MPLYEYVCASCDGKFECYVRSFGEEVTCPSCQGRDVEKQLSTFAFAGGGGGAASSGGGGCGCGRGGCGCGH
ncbi:MAG TPA: zinc ribbon domain-containing protein [Vicinamibacteria bacterium]|jgi:putative FmdB family regulatory protein|nr:zinc ribbon domain-containing protein [Vicinamibacteria bacterium]